MELRVAVGTDDGKNFTNSHFGDSKYFLIYEWDENNRLKFIEKRENIKFDEEKHGDSKKAVHISNQLQGIFVLMAKVFGPNIVKIRKKFVPVVSRVNKIEDALNILSLKRADVEKNLNLENDKEIIYLENK